MTENPNVGVDGADLELPNESVSAKPIEAGIDKSESGDLTAVLNKLDTLEREFRGLQSRQDKDRNSHRDFLDEFNRFKSSGMNEADAVDAANKSLGDKEATERRNQLIDKLLAKEANSSSQAGVGSTPNVSESYSKVLTELELSPTDPSVIDLIRKGHTDLNFAVEAGKLARKRASAPIPTQAQGLASTGSPVPDKSMDAMVVEYKQKVLANRGNKRAIESVKAEYEAKGVPIGQIDVTR